MRKPGKPILPGPASDAKRGEHGESIQDTQGRPSQQQAARQVAAPTKPEAKSRKRRKPFVL
jgi:hypothetical protein